MPITQKHLNANHCHITSKTERNPTLSADRFANVSGDRWVSLYIFVRVGAWKVDALFLERNPSIIIRSTQPTRKSKVGNRNSLLQGMAVGCRLSVVGKEVSYEPTLSCSLLTADG